MITKYNTVNSRIFKHTIFSIILTCLAVAGQGQNYTSYFTGNTTDTVTIPQGGVCMMGGATEDDEAMKWFLARANGGDILVLRTSGSNGYNDYLYSSLGIQVNSVETIVMKNAAASNEPYVHQRIMQAEAIWFAGGDQWDYIRYWRNTPFDSLINIAISERKIVVGGTSAGMAILGGYYFSARYGTVTSAEALANPYNTKVTADSAAFINCDHLSDVITDTHYDNPNRKGRHVVFLARILTDYGIAAKGIACDEYTAVCVDSSGVAHVYGNYPSYNDNAYFIQTNCELANVSPENCSPGSPLDWNLGAAALKVYAVKGTAGGTNTFSLNDWKTASGGTWEHWYVSNGTFNQQTGTAPDCSSSSGGPDGSMNIPILYPNPANDWITIDSGEPNFGKYSLEITNSTGKALEIYSGECTDYINLNISDLKPGFYYLELTTGKRQICRFKLIVAGY